MTCSQLSAWRADRGSTNVTKPKPRLLPLKRSFMTSAASTTPYWLKWRRRVSSLRGRAAVAGGGGEG
jgi:hypothetical protein